METKQSDRQDNDFLQNQQKQTNYLKETGFTNYVSIPRLESIAVVKVFTMLCRLPDVRDAVMQHSHDSNIGTLYTDSNRIESRSGQILQENILNKLSLLPLPNLIKAKLSLVIRPVGKELLNWLHWIHNNIGYDILNSIGYSIINSLCWTSLGIVDRKKTLMELVEANYDSCLLESKQTAEQIYKSACRYCLEDIIPSLWKKLPEETKDLYLNSHLTPCDSYHLIFYWSSVSNNDVSGLCSKIEQHWDSCKWELNHSICKNMFSSALYTSNILAIKYFWEKLTAEEINSNLMQWINEALQKVNDVVRVILHARKFCHLVAFVSNHHRTEKADILFFLLSKISAEIQRDIIQKNSLVILQSLLLFWPYQRFLLPTIQTMWDSLDEKVYLDLLYYLGEDLKIYEGRDFEMAVTKTILKELCWRSPINLKQSFIQDITKGGVSASFILYKLLEMGDMETIKKMISYANVEEQKQLVEEVFEKHAFSEIVDKSNFKIVDQLIQETSLSESDIISLKEKLGLKFSNSKSVYWLCDRKEKFLKWAFASQKRINYFKCNVMKD